MDFIRRRFFFLALLLTTSPLTAQTLTTLHTFTGGNDGAYPYAALIQSGSTLYGTASFGGAFNLGVIFSVNSDGSGFTTLYSFTGGADAGLPSSPLLLSGNTLYGTAEGGATASDYGAVFSVNTDGTGFTTLYSFTGGADGGYPSAALIQSGNTLYGTASGEGTSNFGSIFAVNTDGSGFTILHSFTGGSDGAYPKGALIQVGNSLYGVAGAGGATNAGTIFSINTNGSGFTVLHSFTGYGDGSQPVGPLIVSGKTLYGVTAYGGSGSQSSGTAFSVNTDGTGFTTLHSFTGSNSVFAGGDFPSAGLILAGDTLYGTTENGGASNAGTIFSVNTNGTGFTSLYSFTGGADGGDPADSLIISGNTLYGTSIAANLKGNIFSFSLPLADDSNFYLALATNSDFVSALASTIIASSNNFGLSLQGPQGATGPAGPQGPTGATGATGPQGPAGSQFTPDNVLTNTALLTSLASNNTFVSALVTNNAFVTSLASNTAFLSALATELTSGSTNYGLASKAIQTLNFPSIPVQRFAALKRVNFNATSSAKLTPIIYTSSVPSLGIISGNAFLIEAAGTTTITATQAGNAYFNPATASQTLIVK